ncbi:MAG: acyltransferase [Nitrospirae bacterium]|nr:acyltransferase [Nitrospirota bacterium]
MDNLISIYPHNEIPFSYGNFSLLIICSITLLLIILSLEKKQQVAANDLFDVDTTNSLRGLGIILLLLGHFSVMRIEGIQFFEFAGPWAVIIFLLISGVGLTKTYHLNNCGSSFIKKRIKRILLPTWFALLLFYLLDFLLLKKTYPLKQFALSFSGILCNDYPNGALWFISYTIYNYIIYFCVSLLKIGSLSKLLILFSISCFSIYWIMRVPFLADCFDMWKHYYIVFPVGVLLGLYSNRLFKFLSVFNTFLLTVCMAAAFFVYVAIYYSGKDVAWLPKSGLVNMDSVIFLKKISPVFLILAISVFGSILDKVKLKSKALIYLGRNSFEIYLLHMPFIGSYDFFLFRKPLAVYFFVYISFVLLLSFLLKRAVSFFDGLFFVSTKNKLTPN